MSDKNQQLVSFQTQFDSFTKHLDKQSLVGVVLNSRGAKTVVLERDSFDLLSLKNNENLYFLPQISETYASAEQVDKIVTLFIDVDSLSEDSLKFDEKSPSLLIKRSDNAAFQAFFFLDFELSPEEFKTYQLKLARKFGGDTTVTNANRLTRVAGFTRGKKKKDIKMGISEGLFYQTVYASCKLFSREEIDKIVSNEFDEEVNTFKTQKEDIKIKDDSIFEELERDLSVEEGVFYSYFRNRSQGQGTTQALYRFGCYLLDRGLTLEKFETFAISKGVDVYRISHCDETEWDKLNKDTKKYAKNQQKKNNIEEHTTKNDDKDKSILFEEFPNLINIMGDLKDYYFVEDEDKFYRRDDYCKLTPITKSIFSSTFSKYFIKITKQGRYKPVNPVDVILSKENRHLFNVVSSKLYMPHEDVVCNNKLNTWSYPTLLNSKIGSVDIFLDHIKYLFEGQQTVDGRDLSELFLDFLAFSYLSKTPATFSYLLYAEKFGLGRSFLASVLTKLMGEDNVSTPSDSVAKEQYTGWYSTKQMAIVEELGEDAHFYNKLKSIVGNKRISHRQMNKDSQTVDNHCSIIMLTNKIKALRLAKGDRRVVVVHMHQEPKDKSYYSQLYKWCEFDENIHALSIYLKNRFETIDVESMKGHAPLTEAKLLTQRLVTDPETQNLEELLEELTFGENEEYVCTRDLIDRLYPNIIDANVKYRSAVANRLTALNYSPLVVSKAIRFGDNVKTTTIYVKTSFAHKSKDIQKVVDVYKSFVANGMKKEIIPKEVIIKEKQSIQNKNIEVPEEKEDKLATIFKRLLSEIESKNVNTTEETKNTTEIKKSKKEPQAHRLILRARELRDEQIATGKKHVPKHTCADLKRIRDEFIKSDNIDVYLLKDS